MTQLLILSLCVTAFQGAEGSPESFGRLSRIDGEVYVLKVESDEWEYGTANLLIEEGDEVKVGADDFAEIEFENGTVLWIDEVTRLRIRYLYKDYDGGDWLTGVDIDHGTVRVDVPELEGWEAYVDIETPTGSVTVGEESIAKVIVRRTGASKIIAYNGDVYVAGEWDELYLGSGEAVWINSSGELERPYRIASLKEDRFDRWCGEYRREYWYSTQYIHTDIYIGVHYLDTWGDWVWLVDCGWTWRPRVVRSWRPYSCGRWSWSARRGWFWVSHHPWGWIPFHYGRWAYSPVYGWVWIPGSTWGPGWVAWTRGPGWIAWAPLGVGDRPAVSGFEAYTAVSSSSFASRVTSRPPERGYEKYENVELAKAKWDVRQPERSVVEKQKPQTQRQEVTRVVRRAELPRETSREKTLERRSREQKDPERSLTRSRREVKLAVEPTRVVRKTVRPRTEVKTHDVKKPLPKKSDSTKKLESRPRPEVEKAPARPKEEAAQVRREPERARPTTEGQKATDSRPRASDRRPQAAEERR